MNIWDEKHLQADAEWIKKPSLFAQWVLQYLPQQGRVLDLGAGQGQDSRFFAEQGYDGVSTDYALEGLRLNREQIPAELKKKIATEELDLEKPFPYANASFEVVYAHLSLHYFSEKITRQIFSEIERVLKPGGIIALMVNSIKDPEYNTGRKLEEDYFEISPGMKKRYFSIETMREFTEQFNTLILDGNGEGYKDRRKNVANLIRFVGKKPA